MIQQEVDHLSIFGSNSNVQWSLAILKGKGTGRRHSQSVPFLTMGRGGDVCFPTLPSLVCGNQQKCGFGTLDLEWIFVIETSISAGKKHFEWVFKIGKTISSVGNHFQCKILIIKMEETFWGWVTNTHPNLSKYKPNTLPPPPPPPKKK